MANPLNRNLWVDYLRSALTVLVVAHHSTLAYTTFAWFDKEAYINSTHAIVDTRRWIGLDIFENFNDVFFMSLLFLIGGLFLSKSINRKGSLDFVRDRVYRLLIPFLLGGTFLMLLAYFPSYYVAHHSTSLVAYITDYFTVERYPVGPPWFMWVLFVFNLLFVGIHPLIQKISSRLDRLFKWYQDKPLVFWLSFFSITWLLYVPVAYQVGAGTWTGIGPFDFQLSRIILYFGYFLIGALIGNTDFNNGIFAEKAALVKRWKGWAFLALTVYAILTLVIEFAPLTKLVKDGTITAFTGWMTYYSIYVASCTVSCIAFLTFFRKQVHVPKAWWDSLSENAYLIYLTHYVFVTWIQFALLPFDISAFLKFVVTFVLSLALSWGSGILLRRIKIINKYL